MSDDWDKIERDLERANAGMFVKLKEGVAEEFTFCGKPHLRETVWVNGRSESYDPNKEYAPDANGNVPRPKTQMSINAFNVRLGKMQIFSANPAFGTELVRMRSKHGLDGTVYDLLREKDGVRNVFTVAYSRPMTDEENKEMQSQPLNELVPPGESAEKFKADAGDDLSDEL